MAIQSNFPAIKPSLMLDFANTKQLDSRITYTRASTATFYNGVTTSKAEQNLLTYSQDFDNAAWTKFAGGAAIAPVITANYAAAPDGTTTADRGQFSLNSGTATADLSWLSQGITVTSGLDATFSIWLRSTDGTSSYAMQIISPTSSGVAITVTGTWTQFTVTAVSAGAISYGVRLRGGQTPTNAATADVLIWGAQLEQRSAVSAYTATTTQAITNYIPVLQTAASGVARFDNNPTTGESLGFLIEESRTNLVTYSSEFDNAAWSIVNATVSANAAVAPDGTLTADRLITATTTNLTYARQLATLSAGSATWSVYVKQYGVQYLQLFWGATFNATDYVNFDITNGTVTAGTYTSASITNVGNGWYRCSITSTVAAGSGVYVFAPIVPTSTSPRATNYTGNGYSGAFYWGAQLEQGAFATSYIPTVASTVTRAADAASMTGTNFSSWYAADQGTMYAEGVFSQTTTGSLFFAINDGSTNNRIQLNMSNSTTQFLYLAGGTIQAQLNSTASTLNANNKMCFAYKVNDYAGTVNAGTVGTDSVGVITSAMNQMQIGSRTGSAEFVNSTIKKIAYYPLRVTNAQLQALSS